jgi:hypothetical protein
MSHKPTLAVALALVVCIALTGCGAAKSGSSNSGAAPSGKGTIVNTAKDNAAAVACSTNRAQLAQQLSMAQSTSEGTPPDLATIVAQLKVKCPSGGTYAFDEATSRVACSVHGE